MIYLVTGQKLISNYDPNIIRLASISDSLNYLWGLDNIGLDFETEGFDPYTKKPLTLQLGNWDNQYVIDLTSIDINNYKELLTSNKLFIIANAQFDLRFLLHKNIDVKNICDVMLRENILYCGYNNENDEKDIKEESTIEDSKKYVVRNYGLDKLASKYLNYDLDKSIRGNIHYLGLSQKVIQYAADDVKVLEPIMNKQQIALNAFNKKFISIGQVEILEDKVVRVFAKMLYRGIKLDSTKYKTEVISEVKKTLEESKKKLNNFILEDKIKTITLKKKKRDRKVPILLTEDMFTNELSININWDSPEQKLGILKEYDPSIIDTSSETLKKIQYKYPIVKELLEYNEYHKLYTSFGASLLKEINLVTKRIHPSIWQILSTGRISVSNPKLYWAYKK